MGALVGGLPESMQTRLANGNTRFCFDLGLDPTFQATGQCSSYDTTFNNMNPDCCNKNLAKIEIRSQFKCKNALVEATVNGFRVGQNFQTQAINPRDSNEGPVSSFKLVGIEKVPGMSVGAFPKTAGYTVQVCIELSALSPCPTIYDMCAIDVNLLNPICTVALLDPLQKCCPVSNIGYNP